MGYVAEVSGFETNVDQLRWCYKVLRSQIGLDHINLRKNGDQDDQTAMTYGNQSLYDHAKQKYVISQDHYDSYCDFLFNDQEHYDDPNFTYVIKAIEDVAAIAVKDGLAVGRARFLTLPGKSCLTLHTDNDSALRYHIPIITNNAVFYVINDQVERMPNEGSLYTLQTSHLHTVVNASRSNRVHLVIDTYRKQ